MFTIFHYVTITTMFNHSFSIIFSLHASLLSQQSAPTHLKPVPLDVTMRKESPLTEDFATVKLLVPDGILPTCLTIVSPVSKVNILTMLKHRPASCVLLGLLPVDMFPHPVLHAPLDTTNRSMGNIRACRAIPIDSVVLEAMLLNTTLP